jgi:DNA-directed RNA polymerase specialized sigma24 family protein
MPDMSTELVEAARKGKRDAIVEILAAHYAVVWRMAAGLTGRADVGRGVAKYVMQRSLRAVPSWKDEGSPTRWFHHHTVLTARRAFKHRPDVSNDTLIGSRADSVAYVAFVRAVRELPMQQREAFILSYCERLHQRGIAVAMDCSTTAANNHLREATDRLLLLAPQEFDRHTMHMRTAYEHLSPEEQLALPDIRKRVRGLMIPWVIRRMFRRVALVMLLILTVWGGWWIWRIVENSLEK